MGNESENDRDVAETDALTALAREWGVGGSLDTHRQERAFINSVIASELDEIASKRASAHGRLLDVAIEWMNSPDPRLQNRGARLFHKQEQITIRKLGVVASSLDNKRRTMIEAAKALEAIKNADTGAKTEIETVDQAVAVIQAASKTEKADTT